MLLELLRYTRGYAEFTISGKYPERFINITSRNGVRLWNVKRRGEGFSACMYRSDYRGIRPLARSASVRLRIKKKCGLPTVVFRYRERVGVILGACSFIVTVFIMSLFIWSVDITGTETLSRSQVLDVLRSHGLYVGAFKPALDEAKLARDIMLERHEIGWMAVNVTGSYASVEIKEESPPPHVEDVYTPCNVKARCDGLLLRIEAREGRAVLTEGSGVIAGQLIVSGVTQDADGTNRLVHADARVLARTTRQVSFTLPERFTTLRPAGETAHRRSLYLFGSIVPYRFECVDSPYSVIRTYTEQPAPLGITLPVGTVTQNVSAMEYEETELDNNSAKELLLREAELYEAFALQDCTVESREYHTEHHDGGYTLCANYTCTEDIALSVPIGVEDNG